MGVVSGKFGVVNGFSTVRNWSISEVGNTHAIIASNTKGGTLRKPGIKDWSGSFLQNVDAPTYMPGSEFTFEGLTNPANGIEGGSGPAYEGPAIIDSLAIAWDWATGAPIAQTVNFSANGPLTKTTGTHTDDTTPDPPCADNSTKVEIIDSDGGSGGAGDDELCGVTQATLNVTAANQSYVNACTGGWTYRKAGPIDWNLSLSIDESDLSALPFGINDYKELKLYIDSDSFWHLKYGIVKDFSNLTVDRESGNIVSVTVNFEMSSHDGTSVLGLIKIPDGPANWFPTP